MNTVELVLILLPLFGLSEGKNLKKSPEIDKGDDTWMHKFTPRADTASLRSQFEDAEYWQNHGQSTLSKKLRQNVLIEAEAKNTIFFLGDGMSLPTVTGARIFKGQREGGNGEESNLFFETFPHVGLSKTFCSDSQTADSACSATAYLGGTKANIGTIGVKPTVTHKNCAGMLDKSNHVQSILAMAQAAGKSTGIITTTRITHATPAGAYSHTANREWENDAAVSWDGEDPDVCDDIAEQLIFGKPGRNINVILGGGRREFVPTTITDPTSGKEGKRKDGKNLLEVWEQLKQNAGQKAALVSTKEEFEKIEPNTVDYLFGLFNHDHLEYALESNEEPSLPEMVAKGIQILKRNPNGFFLLVEGGRIDHAHHSTKAQKALMETIVFDESVKVAANMTSIQDTLILVTADHAHTMSISGYPERGSPILGIAETSSADKLPYTIISYANGPGYKSPSSSGDRYDLSDDDLYSADYEHPATFPLTSETHGGDDVGIFSRGPFSHLLTGVVMQSYIPHVIRYASCIGPGLKYCKQRPKNNNKYF